MKFCVIGVGRFGFQVAVTLADNGMEVLAVDSNESMIASLRDRVTQAICMRVADEAALRTIGIEEMDTVVVAMGENFAQSILVTALLKQKLHVPRVIARAVNELHRDVLTLVGADRVVLPEQEMGERLAANLSLPFNVVASLAPGYAISQQTVPERFIKKSFQSIRLQENFNVQCLGLKVEDTIAPVEPDYIFQEGDLLLLSGAHKDLARMAQL